MGSGSTGALLLRLVVSMVVVLGLMAVLAAFLRRGGMGRTQALVEGSRERLRPIMMTMGTAILAMVPISLTNTQMFGNGPEYAPMARAIAGGLAFSTVVSLLFLPTIYAVLDDLRNAVTRLIRRARGLEVVAGTPV